MSATILRTLYPMATPRLSAIQPQAVSFAVAWGYFWLPVNIACLAIAAYAQTHKAVLRLV